MAGGQYADLTIKNAGQALDEVFGSKAGTYIWGIGLLAAGQSSTITGTMSGQFVMQGFLNLKISRAKRSFISRSLAIIPSIIVTYASNPEAINEQLNILQAIQLPFAVIPLLVFCNDKALMGVFRISRCLLYTLITVSLLMVVLNIYAVIPADFDGTKATDYLFLVGTLLYLALITFLAVQKVRVDPDDLEVKQEDKEIEAMGNTSSEDSSEDDNEVFKANPTPFHTDPKTVHSFR